MNRHLNIFSGLLATTLCIAATWAVSPAAPEPPASSADNSQTHANEAVSNVALEKVVDNVGSSGVWSREKAICSGMRVMIVDPDSVEFVKESPRCRPLIGRVAVVYEVATEDSENRLTILDEFGLGTVLEKDVITLRRKDASQQIESRVPKEHRGIAKAEFASLYDLFAAKVAFQNELKRCPENEEFKTRYALFLNRINDLEALAKIELNEHQQEDSVRDVITAALLPQDQRIKKLVTIADDEPKNIFARTELIEYIAFLGSNDAGGDDSPYWTQVSLAHQVATLVKGHPVIGSTISTTVQRALAGKTVDGNGFPALMTAVEQSAQRFPFNSNLTRSLVIGHIAADDRESAQKYTFEAIEKFPADHRTIKTIEVFANSGIATGKMKRFTRRYPVEKLVGTLASSKSVDFDTGALPSVRCIDGNPILTPEASSETNHIEGWKKLCAVDDLITFRYLLANGYDLDSMRVVELKELVKFSIEAKSYHALDFLLERLAAKRTPVELALFEFAAQKEASAMFAVLNKHLGEIPVAVRDTYASELNIESADVIGHMQKDTLDILVAKIPLQFLSSKLKYLSLVSNARKIESDYGQLERNTEQLAILGDSRGYQQGRKMLAEFDRMLREIERGKSASKRSALKELENEFALVKSLLDEQRVDEWTQAVSKHVKEAMPWFKSDFEKWNSNRKRS